MLGKFVSTAFSWLITIVVIALVLYAIGWFIAGNNAAMAGSTVNDVVTSSVEFVRNAVGFA